MRRLGVLLCLCGAFALAGCGRDEEPRSIDRPQIGVKGADSDAARGLGFPTFATKNTTRVGGADAIADAAAVAQAVFPARSGEASRPGAVTLVDSGDWRAPLVASVFMARPVRAPLLFAADGKLPAATRAALDALRPTGADEVGRAQVVRVGDVPRPDGLRSTDVPGKDPVALAAAVDRLSTAAQGAPSDSVVIVPLDAPEFAMPAAAWAAKSGDSVLFSRRQEVPEETMAALRRHQQPTIYVLGPRRLIGGRAIAQLRRAGTVTRIEGSDPTSNAIAFARFADGDFGWGVTDPGHGLVFASPRQPLAAAAAAPLSASGTYGPLLLVDPRGGLPPSLGQYLLDIQPGYRKDPVRGVYNRGWLIGDENAVSAATQSRIDALLEITQVKTDEPSG